MPDLGPDTVLSADQRIEGEVSSGIVLLAASGRCRDGIDHAIKHSTLHYVPEGGGQHIASG